MLLSPFLFSCSEADDLFEDTSLESITPSLGYDPYGELYTGFFDFAAFDGYSMSTNKSLTLNDDEETDGQRYCGSDFHECGVVTINAKKFDTVMAGNIRCITGYYNYLIDGNGVDWTDSVNVVRKEIDGEPFHYFPYSFAKTFNGVKATKNRYLPDGFEELSDWKIMTVLEWLDLRVMVGHERDDKQLRDYMEEWLDMPYNGVSICDPANGNPVVFPDLATFFLEYENVTPAYTYWALGYVPKEITPGYTVGAMSTNVSNSLCAPVKLIQHVKPIFFEADSLKNIAKEYR